MKWHPMNQCLVLLLSVEVKKWHPVGKCSLLLLITGRLWLLNLLTLSFQKVLVFSCLWFLLGWFIQILSIVNKICNSFHGWSGILVLLFTSSQSSLGCFPPLGHVCVLHRSVVSSSLDCSPPGSSVHGDSPGKNIGLACHTLLQVWGVPPGILLEPRSPTLQADSLLSEPSGKPKNPGVGSLSLLQGIFPAQGLNWGLLHCRQIFYQLSYQGSQGIRKSYLHNRGGQNSRWRLKTNMINCLRMRPVDEAWFPVFHLWTQSPGKSPYLSTPPTLPPNTRKTDPCHLLSCLSLTRPCRSHSIGTALVLKNKTAPKMYFLLHCYLTFKHFRIH